MAERADEQAPQSVTLKGAVLREIIAANPQGWLKSVEYDSFGGIKRIEWHASPDEEGADA